MKMPHRFRKEAATILFFVLLGDVTAFSVPTIVSGPCPTGSSTEQAQAHRIRDSWSIEMAGARLKLISLGPNSYKFEVNDLQRAEVQIAAGVLAYSDSEVEFALQERAGRLIQLEARRLDQEHSLIRLATGGSAVNLVFNIGRLSVLLERAKQLDADDPIEKRVELSSQIVGTPPSFELYRRFISREVPKSWGLALLAHLLARGEARDQSGAINVLTSISRFLNPPIHFSAMAGAGTVGAVIGTGAVRTSYAIQTDAACVAACAGVGGVGTYLCQNTTVGSPEWWICLIGTWAITTYCIYACTS